MQEALALSYRLSAEIADARVARRLFDGLVEFDLTAVDLYDEQLTAEQAAAKAEAALKVAASAAEGAAPEDAKQAAKVAAVAAASAAVAIKVADAAAEKLRETCEAAVRTSVIRRPCYVVTEDQLDEAWDRCYRAEATVARLKEEALGTTWDLVRDARAAMENAEALFKSVVAKDEAQKALAVAYAAVLEAARESARAADSAQKEAAHEAVCAAVREADRSEAALKAAREAVQADARAVEAVGEYAWDACAKRAGAKWAAAWYNC